jgi:hypothetical protein
VEALPIILSGIVGGLFATVSVGLIFEVQHRAEERKLVRAAAEDFLFGLIDDPTRLKVFTAEQ